LKEKEAKELRLGIAFFFLRKRNKKSAIVLFFSEKKRKEAKDFIRTARDTHG
jgi:hypothetical protein